MIAFIAVVASFLTLAQFFITLLIKPELILPPDRRSTLLYVILTAANLFWTLYGLASGIILVGACFGVILLYNCIVLFVTLYVKPKREKKRGAKVPYFPQPQFLKNEKSSTKSRV